MKQTHVLARLRVIIEGQGILMLRIAVGIIFFWFGFLKFFGDTSAAESIASRTISWLSGGYFKAQISMPLLAVVECTIGLGILTKKFTNYVLPLLYLQMGGTLLPLVIFPDETWEIKGIVPTLEGQYIIKNAVLIAAGMVLGAVSNGGKLIQDPEIADRAQKDEEQKMARS